MCEKGLSKREEREREERERSLLNGLDLEVETNEGEDKALDVLH